MDFFEEIKKLCRIRDLSVDELMKMIGKPGIYTFEGWKQRNNYPRADDLYKICQIFEISMEHFFSDEKGIVVHEDMVELVKKLSHIPQDDINVLNDLSLDQLKNLIQLAKSMQS